MTTTFGITVIDNGVAQYARSFRKNELREAVEEYISQMQKGTTTDWCSCEWIVHPDDTDKEDKRRLRTGQPDETCPLHTFEGRMLYFFEWLTKNGW